MRNTTSHLYRRVTRLRWQAPIFALLLVLVHQLVEHTWLVTLPRWWHFTTQVLFYGLVGPSLAWWALTSLRHSVTETEAAEHALQKAHHTLREVNAQLTFLLRVNRRLTEAEDEDALQAIIVSLPLQVVPAVGCSLIPFDQHKQPLPALHHGELETAVMERWTTRLAADTVRRECAVCTQHAASTAHPCALLEVVPEVLKEIQVICLELARGERAYGILNIYLPENYALSAQEQSLLQAIAQEMSLALESHALRSRELEMLYRVQAASRLSELHDELADVLAHTVEALDVEGGILFVADMETADWQPMAEAGRSLGSALPLVQGLAAGGVHSGGPVVIRELEQADSDEVHSLLVAPLHAEGQLLGSLVLWSDRHDVFSRRRTQLVAVVAGQAALLVANHRLYLQGEHRAALAERARLAREIHDGLAQTLGYLKLRTAQIAGWLQDGETERVAPAVADVHQLLQEAYTDAREAIDGLRLRVGTGDLNQWLPEIVTEFEMLSGVRVETAVSPDIALPPEVHVQLQRIVQEALSNVRKHAHATHVWLEWQQSEKWLSLRIRDNGCGFDPDDVPLLARHGLRIMRERAELLDADFQITSCMNNGTEISVTLPMALPAQEVPRG